jgi:hypothetical protein
MKSKTQSRVKCVPISILLLRNLCRKHKVDMIEFHDRNMIVIPKKKIRNLPREIALAVKFYAKVLQKHGYRILVGNKPAF